MPRRPRDADATRKSLLDKAEQLFVRQGFASTSMAQIGNACGCANSLIVHHFGNKEGLWNAVKDRAFGDFVKDSMKIFSARPVDLASMKEAATGYFNLLKDNPGVVQLLLRAQLERDLTWNEYNREQLAPFVQRMTEAQAAGLLRDDVPPAHLLLILINVITRWFEARHMFADWEELGDSDKDASFLASVLKVVFEGALAPPGREALA